MFTGIVSATARVLAAAPRGSGALLSVERPDGYGDAKTGESIAVSGVCLTLLDGGARELAFDVSPETLRRSTLGTLRPGARVNLERAMLAGDRFGGHIVAGHVDATTPFRRVAKHGDFSTFTFAVDRGWSRYVVEKGSIALDGVSLTVADLRSLELDVAVVPHTLAATTLGDRAPGDLVNVEVDVLGKYVERLLAARGTEEDRRLERLLDRA
jgi:riboflavin synthase